MSGMARTSAWTAIASTAIAAGSNDPHCFYAVTGDDTGSRDQLRAVASWRVPGGRDHPDHRLATHGSTNVTKGTVLKHVSTKAAAWRASLGIVAAAALLLTGCSTSSNSTAVQSSPTSPAGTAAPATTPAATPAVANGTERAIG